MILKKERFHKNTETLYPLILQENNKIKKVPVFTGL